MLSNELFWTEEVPLLLACYVDGKAGYATFKVKDAVTKRNHNQQQSL
jgi:hypothetical protein